MEDAAATAAAQEAAVAAQEEEARALSRALRLFSLYVAAGGALCMRQPVWRRIVARLHPDRGGSVAAFQAVADLKRAVDAGDEVALPAAVHVPCDDAETEALHARISEELRARAADA